MFEVHEAERKNHPYEVRWNEGRCYCRCNSWRDANKIALAMNLARTPVKTLDELRALHLEEERT